jgi:glycosyltransferase involved in cell wall biosynthesis
MNSGASKRVLILELGADGHHPFYIRLLLESGLADDAHIILAGQQSLFTHRAIAECPVPFEPYLLEIALEHQRLWASSPTAVFRRSWAIGRMYRSAYAELSRTAPIDLVIVPYLDDCLLGLAGPRRPFGTTPWLSITMRTMFHFDVMGVTAPRQRFTALRRGLTYRMLRQPTTAALLTIDPILAEFASTQRAPMFRKIHYLPDPAPQHLLALSQQQARAQLGIAPDAPGAPGARLVLVYGDLSSRKGIFSLVEAAAAADCSERVHLLLAGRNRHAQQLEASSGWRTLIARQRIHLLEGFIDDDQEGLLLLAADCMWVGYVDFYGVSSVMALAARNAMPVIASDYGLVGYLAGKHGLGAVVEPRNIASIVTALNRLVNEPEFFARAGRAGVAAFHDHAPIEFQRRVMATVRQSWGSRD